MFYHVMYKNYEEFLKNLEKKLEALYEEQKPYIFCKKGCSRCCSQGQYPMSRYEFNYLIHGFEKLETKTKKLVLNRIKKLHKISQKSKNQNIEHSCPFLISNLCCVYSHRPLICRTFGLIKSVHTLDGQPVAILPDCLHNGLNYSNVFDFETKEFDEAKIVQIGHTVRPLPYDIGLLKIYEECEDDSIDFGDRKNMLEFFNEFIS